MNITPLSDRVLVKTIDKEEQIGSIIIPDTVKEKPQEGIVESVGSGKLSESGEIIPMNVKKGDTVLFGKYSGSELKIGGEKYLIMREEDIFGIMG